MTMAMGLFIDFISISWRSGPESTRRRLVLSLSRLAHRAKQSAIVGTRASDAFIVVDNVAAAAAAAARSIFSVGSEAFVDIVDG